MPSPGLDQIEKTLQRAGLLLEGVAQQVAESTPHRLTLDPGLAEQVCKGTVTTIITGEPLALDDVDQLLLTDQDAAYGTVRLEASKPMSLPEFRSRAGEHGITADVRKHRWPRRRRLYAARVLKVNPWDEPRLLKISGELSDPQYVDAVAADAELSTALLVQLKQHLGGSEMLVGVAKRLELLTEPRGTVRVDLAQLPALLAEVDGQVDLAMKARGLTHEPPVAGTETPFDLASSMMGDIEDLAVPQTTRLACRSTALHAALQSFTSLEKAIGPDPLNWRDVATFCDMEDLAAPPPTSLRRLHKRAGELLAGPLQRQSTIGGKSGASLRKLRADIETEMTRREQMLEPIGGLCVYDGGPAAETLADVSKRHVGERLECEADEAARLLAEGYVTLASAQEAHQQFDGVGAPSAAVLHKHIRGDGEHYDLRIQVGKRMLGYAMVPTGDDIFDSLANGTVYALPKPQHSAAWLQVEKMDFEPGELGATEDEVGSMEAVASPIVHRGVATEDMHEYFLEGDSCMQGRLVVRRKASAGGEYFWSIGFAEDLTPVVLSKADCVPPFAWSCLPPAVQEMVPDDLRYWEQEDIKKRKGMLEVLKESGELPKPGELHLFGGRIRQVVAKHYLVESIDDDEPESPDGTQVEAAKAKFDAKYVNKLPDSAFLHIASGGKKDKDGRTVPRSLRYFPVRDANGKVDAGQVKQAMSRLGQSDLPKKLQNKLRGEAFKLLGSLKKSGEDSIAPFNPPLPAVQDIIRDAIGQEAIDRLMKRQFKIFKYATSPAVDEEDEEERFVLGVVLVPDEEDSQGDIYNEAEVRKAAHYYMEFGAALGLMHEQTLSEAKVRVLESYLAPVDFNLEGQSVKKGTWLLAARILDDDLWDAIKEGRLTGWSMEGTALAFDIA